MGMFGRPKQTYETAGIAPPKIGSQILNQIGMNLLGVDFEGRRVNEAMGRQRAAFMSDLERKVQPEYAVGEDINVDPNGGNAQSWQYQAPVKTRDALNINSAELPALALKAQKMGVPLAGLLDVLQAQQPDVAYDRGYGFNRKTGAPVGEFHTEMDKGMRPGAGGVVENAPGYVRSAAEAAGAVTGAQEQAKAGYDMVEVKVGGRTVQLPRSVALPLITQAFGAQNPGSLPAGFGQGESPADASAAKIRADAQAEAGIGLPQASAEAQGALDLIGKLKTHPGLGSRTGMTAMLPAIPGTPGFDFDTSAEQLKGKVFQQAYQSLKGAGAITDMEGRAATAAIARLNQRQTQEGYVEALDELEGIIRAGVERQQNKAGRSSSPPPPDAVRAELIRRGLIK